MTAAPPPRANPFLELSPLVRLLILFYLIAYRVVFPLIHALMSDGAKDLLVLRFLAELCLTGLIAFPFLFHRREYGWLHPLVLPALFAIGKAITKNPLALIFPLEIPTIDFAVETMSSAATLSISANDLAWTRLQLSLVLCFAQSVYLLAFLFGPRFRIPRIAVYPPKYMALSSLAAITLLLSVAVYFIVSQGGVAALLVAMRGGRVALFTGQGQFLFAAGAATTIAIAWFMYERKPWSNPLLLFGLIASMTIAIIVSGSRSSLILVFITVILLWWKRKGRALILPIVAAAGLSLIVIGTFGSIRQDYGSTVIDTSALNPSNYGAAMERALADIARRSTEESDLAVMAGSKQNGLLGGRTYLGAAAFWVPRALWPDKPRSADAYNMWVNYANQPIDSALPDRGLYGIPVSAQMEAYWSFGPIGVLLLFGLLGLFHLALVRSAYVYDAVPFFWPVYMLALISFTGTTREGVDLVRNFILLALFALMVGIVRLQSSRLSPAIIGGAMR